MTDQVVRMPPAVPSDTTMVMETERTAVPGELFAAHVRKAGPPGKDQQVLKKILP
jgi:hypothetical protein